MGFPLEPRRVYKLAYRGSEKKSLIAERGVLGKRMRRRSKLFKLSAQHSSPYGYATTHNRGVLDAQFRTRALCWATHARTIVRQR